MRDSPPGRWFELTRMKVNGRVRRHVHLRSGDRIEVRGARLTFRDEVR